MTTPESGQSRPPGRSLGQGMLLGSWVVGMAAATWFFNGHIAGQQNPNQQPLTLAEGNSVAVVLERNRADHYIATGSINGEQVVFLLDTGATSVVVPGNLASRLDLPRGRTVLANTANGTIEVHQSSIRDLRLGGIQLTDVGAAVNPAMDGEAVLLGMTALAALELEQRGKTLTLRQQQP